MIPDLGLIIEFDGGYSHLDREDVDREKTALLEHLGWRVIRVRQRPLARIYDTDVLADKRDTAFDITTSILRSVRDDYPDYHEAIDVYLGRVGPAAAAEARRIIQEADARRARNSRRRSGSVSDPDDWTDSQLTEAYVNERMTLSQLAEKSGYPVPLLRQVLTSLGVEIRKGRRGPVWEGDPEELANLYRSGASLQQLATKTGYSPERVSRLLKDMGVAVVMGRARGPRKAAPAAQVLHDLYVGQELTLKQVGAELGLSDETVRKRLVDAGIPIRRRGTYRRK